MDYRARILIVDDELFNITLLEDLLSSIYDTMVAKDGKQALQRVQSVTPPDLILLDIMMPGMDGYEVCWRLKANEATREIPVIFVTALEGINDEAKGLELGAVDYITKPVSPSIVKARVNNHISLHRARQELEEKNQDLFRWRKEVHLLMRHTPAAIAMFDKQMRYMHASHRWTADYNRGQESVLGRSHFDIVPNLSQRWKDIYKKCLQGTWDKQEAEPFFDAEHGTTQWFTWEAFPWRDALGEIGGVIMHIEDVTARKMLEEEVLKHRDHLAFEKEFIETIILKMRQSAPFDDRNLVFLDIPLEKIAGDLLLAAYRPDGGQHVIVGDFTGHGLPAAIASPMVSDMFYTMTKNGLPMGVIQEELNRQLHTKMPLGMFFAATFLEINPQRNKATIWNCGAPDVILIRNGKVHTRIHSSFFARGVIVRPEEPGVEIALQSGDRLFATTDGIEETHAPSGSGFGQEALENLLLETLENNEPFERLPKILETFRGGMEQKDDITLAGILIH